MAARRLILVMLVLLIVSSVGFALVPVPSSQLDQAATTAESMTRAPVAEPNGELVAERIRAGSGKPREIEVGLGDQLELTVVAQRFDQVAIARLGVLEDVDRGAPAVFDLLPIAPGSYAVRLLGAGETIARIEVVKAGTRPQGGEREQAG